MTASIEAIIFPAVDNELGKTSLIARQLRSFRSQVIVFFSSLRKANNTQTEDIRKNEETSLYVKAQRNAKALRRNEKSQPHLAHAASATVDRLTPEKMISSHVLDNAVGVLDEAIVCHQGDDIVGARKNVTNLFTIMVMNQKQCFEFPSKYGLKVLDRGRKLFLEEGVSCSIKHGTLLLDSSTNGAQFYSGLLNVMGAFALLISEFKIAKGTFDRLIELHRQSDTTSRSRDLASAYSNKGCVHLIMGDLREAEEAFNTSLKYLVTSNESLDVTKVFAVKSNMSRLNLVSREYRQALEQQEKLAESCKATVMKEIPYPFEAVFTVMNNQAVLHTTLGKFDRAEQALWWLISYCKEINRKDSEYLVTFLHLHLSEVLILHGKSKAADEMFSIENLNSLEDIVKRFGNLYMNVRIEALEKLLELYIRRGKIRAALQLLQRTVKILKTVFGPDHFNIASLLYKQGTILSLTGEVSQAAEKFKISIEILRKIFGVKNFLLLKCYMSLGDVKSRMNQEEESYLYFQRATENIEAIYQVSFVNELRIKYLEITRSFNTFQKRKVSDDRIEGLVAEYGQGVAFWINHHSNCQLRTCRANRKRFLVKNTEGPFSESTSVAFFKYSSDFIKSGQKLLRLGMIKESAVFFQYAELHSRVHVIPGYPDLNVASLHSVFLEEKFRSHRVLQYGDHLRKLLEDLRSFIEGSGAQRVVQKTNGVATTMEFDYQRNLRAVLILLLLFSIELKMTETTFVAYDLFSKLFQHETDFPFLLLDGMQVYASRAMITCNGQTAVQDIFVSSEIGLNESDTEKASTDSKLYHSLAYQENTTGNAFLVTGRSPVLLDIEDLNTVKDKISLAVQECFQTKCMAAEAKGGAMTVVVDLTPTAKCGLQDILSMGCRIDLLPLCLSERPSTGIPNKEAIFEMDTSMYQTTTEVTFEDQQSCCFIFKKTALRLLQQNDPRRISSLALASHSLSITILHPRKVRIILSQSGERVTQKTQFVSTRKKVTGLADPKATFETSVLDVLPLPEIHQTIVKYGVPCQQRTLSKIPLEQSATPCETNSSSNHGRTGAERSSQIYRGETIGTSELEGRQEQTRENVLQCLRTISQISRTLYSVESPVTDNVVCLADLSQRHDAYESQEDTKHFSRKDKSSLLDLADDDSRRPAASFQSQEDQENTSGTLQHFTESSEENENNECLALNVPDITTVEASTSNHGDESILREEVCLSEGKRLFEDDRKSRLSFIADLQKSLKDKPQNRLNPTRGDCIQSNRVESNDVSKLQSSHMQNDNLEVLYQNPEAQAPSPIPTFRNVITHENSQRSSSLEGKTAKEEDKLMRIHPSPRSPAPNNVRDCNDLEDVSSRWPKTTLEKEDPFAANDKSDGSSLLERKTHAENVETARNDIRSSTQNTAKTKRETTSRNQEVQDTLRADEEGQRQTKSGANNFKSRKQHSMEGSQRIEVEITGYGTKTPKNQEPPCPDYDDKATRETFGSRAGEVLPDRSMHKETFRGQNNVVDVLNEKHIVDGPNLEEENGMYSIEKREPTIHSKSRATISDCYETTTTFRCQGGDLVADGESHKNLAVDGSVLAKHSDKDNHAFVFISNHEVEDAVGDDREGRRQTAPDISKFKIKKQDFQGKERSGVEILRRDTNTPEKQGISCSDHNEMTTDRTFEALGSNQRNVIDLERQRCFVDGPNLTEENRAQPLKQGSRAMDPISSYRKIHLKSQTTTSNRHETRTRSMCQGGDVVADGESIEDNLNNVDIVDGPELTQHPHKAFNGGESFTANIKHTSVTSSSKDESPTDRDALCEYRYLLKSKTDLFQTHSGDGGARPKQRSTDNTKSPLLWPSVKNPFSAYCDLELENPDLDPRHVKESSQFPSFHYGGNYNYASLDGPWLENYEQEYSSFNAHDQVFKGKGQKSPDKKEFIPHDIAHKFKMSVPVYNASVTKNLSFHRVSPPNGDEKESWHFPSSESWEDRVPRSQCFSERTNESNPTSLPKSFDADCEKLFDTCGSVCAYNDMDSMANEYSSSIANDEWGQSLPQNEDKHSSTEHSLATSFRYLQEIMAETIRLVVSKATGARETQPANQPVEKTGVQEETGDMGEEEPVITQQVNETNIRGESTPSNETTIEAERQPMATPVQESPRPVCSHYQRRCLVRFPCCGKFFPCHRCHNESDCSEDQARAINATHIRCTICYHEQEIDENGQRCGGCNAIMSEYFCPICCHYTSMDKNPFHCEKCGICRIHRDRSFHCDVCNVCLDKRLEGKHKCRPDSGHDECCICLEDAFSGCQILPCSHKVHKDCAIAMIQNGVRKCPICRHPLFGQLQTSSQN